MGLPVSFQLPANPSAYIGNSFSQKMVSTLLVEAKEIPDVG